MYVVVAIGYEGIDRIFWAGPDVKEAKAKVLACRQHLSDLVALPDDERHEMDDAWLGLDEPARICVQKQTDNDRFQCCCKELGVSAKGGPYWY